MSEFSGSLFERAQEAPEEVVVTRPVAETRGLQPEDLGALVYLLLLEPGALVSGRDCVAGMRALSWKMSDERFAKIAKRLTQVGHLCRKSVYNPDTGRPQWCYSAYRNPANNPAYVAEGTDALSQVSDGNRKKRGSDSEPPSEHREKRVSPGQSRNPLFPASEANTAKSGAPSDDVSAGQSRNPENAGFPVPPPHPPEEVTTSSPNPLTNTSGRTSLPSPREEGEAGYAEEDLQAAADVLQLLPDPWTQGRLNASKLAPKLLGVMAEQGWPGIHTVDRALLTRQLTKNPHKITNPYRLLAGDRIPNLPRYVVVAVARESSPGSTPDGMCLKHPQYRAGSRCIPCVAA
ncbi:hypothetical protein ACFVRD_37455 [Streptomyces sp. NPDC057908]|uniref:hypothetical protein n=1 Tax=Streptomyces sp. NPDC057908 TaxID=3346276 RepID=UPI0036EC4A7F